MTLTHTGNDPLVSIIMPAFNSENTISQSIESVLNQTYQNWELIVVDDGSEDGTRDLLNRFQDQRIHIRTQTNQGISAARNKAIEHAQGDFIAFLDADDYWLPVKLEKQVAAITAKEAGSGLIHSNYREFNERGEYAPKPHKHIPKDRFSGEVYNDLIIHDFVATSTVMLDKRVLSQSGWFDTSLKAGVDWDLWIRVARHTRFAYLDETLAYYRLNPRGVSKNYMSYEKELGKIYASHLMNSDLAKNRKYFALWLFYRHMAHGLARQFKFRDAGIRLFKAIVLRPFNWKNLLSIGYLGLHMLRSLLTRKR